MSTKQIDHPNRFHPFTDEQIREAAAEMGLTGKQVEFFLDDVIRLNSATLTDQELEVLRQTPEFRARVERLSRMAPGSEVPELIVSFHLGISVEALRRLHARGLKIAQAVQANPQ